MKNISQKTLTRLLIISSILTVLRWGTRSTPIGFNPYTLLLLATISGLMYLYLKTSKLQPKDKL